MINKVKSLRLITAVTYLKGFQRNEHVSFSDEESWLETLEFIEITHGSYQSLNFEGGNYR